MPTKDLDIRTGRYTVAFRLPPEAGAEQAWVAGDFNGWSTEALPMHREADGGMLALVEDLEPGTEIRFRYYLGGGAWENDWAADAYVDNEFGGADSLLVLPAVEPPPDVKAPGADPGEPLRNADSATGAAAEAAAVVEETVMEPAKADAPVEKKAPAKKKSAAKKVAPAKKAAAKKKA
jgi:hypothetical protein